MPAEPVRRPMIGRCPVKGCTYARRTWTLTRPRDRGRRYPIAWDPDLPGGGGMDRHLTTAQYRTRYPDRWAAARVEAWIDAGMVCPTHDRPCRITVVVGTLDPTRVCDARCMGATGPQCSCSCGGANHGGKHDPHTYAEQPAEYPTALPPVRVTAPAVEVTLW